MIQQAQGALLDAERLILMMSVGVAHGASEWIGVDGSSSSSAVVWRGEK